MEQEQETGLGRRGRGVGGGARPGFGPVLLLVPTAAFAVATLWMLRVRPTAGDGYGGTLSDARSHGIPDEVEGFMGEHRLPGGAGSAATLRVRLTPLHPAASHQEFETNVLRRRLGRDDGEPWRLELSLGPAPEPEVVDDAFALGITPVRVEDRDGAPLGAAPFGTRGGAPLPPAGEAHGPPFDPVEVLLSTSPAWLAPGEESQCLLWGRRPGEDVRLILGEGSGRIEIALEPASFPTGDLPRSLARIDPPRAPAQDEATADASADVEADGDAAPEEQR